MIRSSTARQRGSSGGGMTTITVTYYEVTGPYGQLTPFETFTLQRPRG